MLIPMINEGLPPPPLPNPSSREISSPTKYIRAKRRRARDAESRDGVRLLSIFAVRLPCPFDSDVVRPANETVQMTRR